MDDRNVLFRVGCEGGTYIRKLCYDIGEILGVGAHMQELRRARAGPFTESDTRKVTLHDVKPAFAQWQETNDESLLLTYSRFHQRYQCSFPGKIRSPFIRVPFLLPKSFKMYLLPFFMICTCFLDTVLSPRRMSASRPLPMVVTSLPSSKECPLFGPLMIHICGIT
jgi:hypothetical protein